MNQLMRYIYMWMYAYTPHQAPPQRKVYWHSDRPTAPGFYAQMYDYMVNPNPARPSRYSRRMNELMKSFSHAAAIQMGKEMQRG